MFKILEVYESGEYDTIIVDCAPAGKTPALLKCPERLSGFIKKYKNELAAGVGNESRKFPVPAEFAEKAIAGAKFKEGYLNIKF